jgi:hypothetical protein
MGIVIGALIVLVLLVGGWWLFMRQSVPVTPDTTIIEQPAPDTTIIEQPAPDPNVEGDTNVIVPDNGGTEQTSTP